MRVRATPSATVTQVREYCSHATDGDGSGTRRVLATQCFAQAAAEGQALRVEPLPEEFWPPPEDKMGAGLVVEV